MKKNNIDNQWENLADFPDFKTNAKDYQKIWESSKNVEFPDFDEDKALKHLQKKILTTRTLSSWIKYASVAASLLLIATLSVIVLKKTENNKAQFVEITVKKGEKLSINLPDGNKVWLNSNSTIKYPANFTGYNRRIEITGEAFFEFKSNLDYPIMIATKNVFINCEAGNFNVKCTNDGSNYASYITVEKGKVLINNNILPEAITIESGYLATLTSYLPLFIEENPAANFDAWKTGKLTFRKVSLASVAEDLTEYYGVPVRINGDIKYCEFTSNYQDAEISAILNDVQQTLKASVVQKAHEIIITGSNCL